MSWRRHGINAAGHPVDPTTGHGSVPCSFPRYVPTRPDHVPSTVVACFRLPDTSLLQRPSFVRIGRTECVCGWAWGRTRTDGRRWTDDVTVRGEHAGHVWAVGRREQRAAAERQAG